MALPKINTAIYTTTLPSTGKKVEFRPFLVKEEKIVLLALQDGSSETLVKTIKEVIDNCTFAKLDISALTPFDIDFLFLQLRIHSKGKMVDLSYTCTNKLEADGLVSTCGHQNTIVFDLSTAKVEAKEGHTKKIMITDTIGILMKYPSFEQLNQLNDSIGENNLDDVYKIFELCIDEVFENDKIYEDFTTEELQEWIENLDQEQFEKVNDFFTTMPALKAKVHVKCAKCGHEEDVDIEGLHNFLG